MLSSEVCTRVFFNLYSNVARVGRTLSIEEGGGVFVTRSVAANLNFDHVDLIRLEIGRVIFSGITNSEIFAIMCFVITVALSALTQISHFWLQI